jgi:hypothetical protein
VFVSCTCGAEKEQPKCEKMLHDILLLRPIAAAGADLGQLLHRRGRKLREAQHRDRGHGGLRD